MAAKFRGLMLATAGFALAWTGSSYAAGPALTEADFVRAVAENPGFSAAVENRRSAAEARAKAAGALPNPEVELQREGADGFGGDGTEDSFRLRYSLDIGGVRAAERRAGLARRDAELAGVEASVASRVAGARRLYHEAIGLGRRATIRRVTADRLTEVEGLVRRRVAEGDAADLELRRVEADASVARTGAMRLEAEAAGKWAELQGYLGPAAGTFARPTNAIPLPTLAPLDTYLALAAEAPDARRVEAAVRAAEVEGQALARRARTPEAALVGGLRTVDNPMGRTTGAIVGVTVSVPFSGGPRAEAQARTAEARALRAEQRLTDDTRRNAVIGVWSLAQRLTATASAPPRPPEAILPPAESAYEAGEIDVSDLLAAHRTAAEAAIAQIDLEQEAALARVRLDELVGKTAL